MQRILEAEGVVVLHASGYHPDFHPDIDPRNQPADEDPEAFREGGGGDPRFGCAPSFMRIPEIQEKPDPPREAPTRTL